MVAGHPVCLQFVRHRRARHYILRVANDGGLRVTIPRGGSIAEGERFVCERRNWIERERARRAFDARERDPLSADASILVRGALVPVAVASGGGGSIRVTFAGQEVFAPESAALDLRPVVEHRLRQLAARELPARLAELAGGHGFTYTGTSVRNQRSRWGSCSPSGHISLNWRLIQFPPQVADYVLLHELTHLRHLDHSRRFWAELDRICPGRLEARAWLRAHHRGRIDGT